MKSKVKRYQKTSQKLKVVKDWLKVAEWEKKFI